MIGQTSMTRRSCVAALFPAATTCAASSFPLPSAPTSRSLRWTEPNDQLSSAAPQPTAGFEFQSRITPDAGLIAWGWAFTGRMPRQSNSPVPEVGNAGSVPGARIGSRPVVM